MNIFLTGGTGLLGSNIINCLLDNNYSIKSLVRSNSDMDVMQSKGIKGIKGDLIDVKSFAKELIDCQVLIHAGAYFSEYFKNKSNENLLYEVNVKGTSLLFEEAHKAGVHNFIYISSSCVFNSNWPDIITENTPYAENNDNPYFKSKTEAEISLLKLAEKYISMRLIILSPALMMGPGDKAPTRMGEFVLNYLTGKIPAILPIKMAFVDARDVAKAVVAAITKGINGERYLIGGNVYEMSEVVKVLSEITMKPIPKIRPSLKMTMFLSRIMTFKSKLTGKPSKLPSISELKRMSTQKGYSSEKAKKEFNIQFHTLFETLSATVNWYIDNHYIHQFRGTT